MRKEIIETAKTVDDAINSACEQLGCDRDDCEWEIIDLPKKTFLGLKTQPAKVRVSVEIPEEAPPAQPKPEPRKAAEPKRREAPAPRREPSPERKAPETRPQQAAANIPGEPELPRVLVSEGFTEKELATLDYIRGILREFGLTAEFRLYREGNGIYIDIEGESLGTIIGRRGETLDAIQYLSGLVANRLEGDYLRVTVDCGDYRTKRKSTLEALAQKLAAQVLKSNVSKTLEPMNPFERRVIHATISKIEGVTSSSIGEEPNRRVVITTPTARRPSARSSSRGGRGGRDDRRGGRGGRGGSFRASAPVPSGPPKETPESLIISDTPIGKLDLD